MVNSTVELNQKYISLCDTEFLLISVVVLVVFAFAYMYRSAIKSFFLSMLPKDNFRTSMICTTVFSISLGFVLIVVAYFIGGKYEFRSYLLSSIGCLSIFGASYSCYSELFLKESFKIDVEKSVSRLFDIKAKDDSIEEFGVDKIVPFSEPDLLKKIKESETCVFFALYYRDFFKKYHRDLKSAVQGRLQLDVIMVNPDCEECMKVLENNFDGKQANTLKTEISEVVETYITERIYNVLDQDKKSKLSLRLLDWPATYSAYVFNGNEMWFLPRHSGKGKVDPVVFVLKGDSLKDNIYFKDIEFIVKSTSKYDFDISES